MKNFYANGYAVVGICDGHDWTSPEPPIDAARCRDCGAQYSNAQIARGDVPACTIPATPREEIRAKLLKETYGQRDIQELIFQMEYDLA